MKILNKFIWSKTEPKNKNDVWFDGSVFRLFKEEEWQAFTINLQDANEVVKLKDFLTKYLSEEIIPAVEDAKEAVKTIQIYVDLAVDSVRQATEAVNKAEDLTSRAETVIPQAENVVRDITVFKDTIQGIWDNLYIEINNAISNANEAADRANNSIVFYPISDGDVSIIMGNLPRTDSFVEDYTGHTYVYNNTHGLWYLSSDLSICTQIPSIQSYNVEEEGRVFVQNISYVYNPETNRYEGQGLYGKLPIRLLLDGIEELGGQEGALFTNDGGHNMLLKTKQQLTDSEKNQVKENLGITGSGSYDDTEIKQNLTELSSKIDEVAADSSVFEAIYGETTYEEIKEARNKGKYVVCVYRDVHYHLSSFSAISAFFSTIDGANSKRVWCNANNNWFYVTYELEPLSNKVKSLSSSSTDTQYPSAKAVYDFVNNTLGTIINGEY